jgi:hypothetical protein
MATHYEKEGPWLVRLTSFPELSVDVQAAHTARDAWRLARPELLDMATAANLVALVDFSDCTFEQVTSRPRASNHVRSNTDRERIHRLVGADRPAFLSGSGRA